MAWLYDEPSRNLLVSHTLCISSSQFVQRLLFKQWKETEDEDEDDQSYDVRIWATEEMWCSVMIIQTAIWVFLREYKSVDGDIRAI